MAVETSTVSVIDIEWLNGEGTPVRPTLRLSIDTDDTARSVHAGENTTRSLVERETDVIFRIKPRCDGTKPIGLLSVADRITGEPIFETKATVTAIDDLVTAAQIYVDRTDAECRYQIRVQYSDDITVSGEKQILLVYDSDGTLLRDRSLIPCGIEI